MIEQPIRGEIYSVERLEEYAAYLGAELKISDDPRHTQSLMPRMRDNGAKLLAACRVLTQAANKRETLPPAAEWLLDNFHIVEDQLREIKEDLPPSFYKELPKISLGDLSGYPRIYAIALALVAHTNSQLEPETIKRFVQAYQKVTPLNIGELWALAITLRLVLVENLRRIAVQIVIDHDKKNQANVFSDKLFAAVSNKAKYASLLQTLPHYEDTTGRRIIQNDCAYIAQIAKRLRDQEGEISTALEFLENLLAKENLSTEQVVHRTHQMQASNQVTIANIITSMRLISSLNWQNFFESLSQVDRILETDPVYKKMDFLTRDRYRHVIEKISRRTGAPELTVAEQALHLTQKTEPNPAEPPRANKSHVGYYLIDRGLLDLEKEFRCRTQTQLLNFAFTHPNLIYFSHFIFLLVITIAWPLYNSTVQGASLLLTCFIGMLVLIPCSELAQSLTNLYFTNVISPKHLPKLDLTAGVPSQAKTMVVIPCMLTNARVIENLIEKLETHFLGNSDPHLFFALLTDYSDAKAEVLPGDELLLKQVRLGLENLNQKYSQTNKRIFFNFHRSRLWNPSEKVWMGWERKRGKIHEFNRLLRGASDTSFINVETPSEFLRAIRFVITLDADTQLPRDTAAKLIGTILHPLNQAYFDPIVGRVTEGYAVLQPRIGISLESSSRSFFSKIFSGYTGIDPYTTAVSEIYQDLFHEGSYTGKGLYDVDAFEAALQGRVPENSILSHDLFEGLYARAALITDIELLDDYPREYKTAVSRQHRWIRGDWQIAGWILPFVQNEKKQWVRNNLPFISRWKIFDNLRRSLVAPFTFLWFVLSWTFFPGNPSHWISYALLIIIAPSLLQVVLQFIVFHLKKTTLRSSSAELKIKVSALQTAFDISFLAHQAYVNLDAIIRATYRRFVSKEKLLEWATADQEDKKKPGGRKLAWETFWPVEIALLSLLLLLSLTSDQPTQGFAFFFIPLWMAYPLIAFIIGHNLSRVKQRIVSQDQLLLRKIARLTWHFFETFVGPDDNWLPPDNHQENPQAVTAHRTSPTNIGLYLLSLTSAHDFGYLSTSDFIQRLTSTLTSLRRLELYQGHLFNWYDTKTLQVLSPKYISTVDSGNIAGYLLAAIQVCLEVPQYLICQTKIFRGLNDALAVIESHVADSELAAEIRKCRDLLQSPLSPGFSGWLDRLRKLELSFEMQKNRALLAQVRHPKMDTRSCLKWMEICSSQVRSLQTECATYAPWMDSKFRNLGTELEEHSPELGKKWKAFIEPFHPELSFASLRNGYDQALALLDELLEESQEALALQKQLLDFSNQFALAQDKTQQLLDQATQAAESMDQMFKEMNFSFLIDKDREIFTIGYNVSNQAFDSGLYDLLGSESRLASFVAIAKGEVPQKHWFRLGRQLVPVSGGRALVSWTASMFEYLMPLLVMRDYANTLLDETAQTIVARQISYGHDRHVPWGVSEAGYNARDLQLNYQYGPFGIPGLGLKRGLSHDLVISPYSTILAAMVNPGAALLNLKRLIDAKILANYGFYEALDYTPERLPENHKFVIVKSFMAHHQGMSLIALNNVLNNNIMQNRFHNDPRVRATRLLLQERIPQGVVPILPKAAEVELETEHPTPLNPLIRRYTDPNSSAPHLQLLSNRNYSLMISTAGSGYSRCGDLAITRWREDSTRDNWGSYIFIRDPSEGAVWSTTYQPLAEAPSHYHVTFAEEKVQFRRRDKNISTHTQILVAPEDNVEIRHVTLTNHSQEPRVLELTSYLEPVLAPMGGDLDHMTFSKLFIQTEYLASKNALLAHRRRRSALEKESWGLHVVVSSGEILSEIQYETDRESFIGRGRSVSNPAALFGGKYLSNTAGTTLDPILSLRVIVRVPANGKANIAFTTGYAASREEALALADRYHDIHSFERESQMAWTKSQVDMRHLGIDSETSYVYQRLAERILYSQASPRIPASLRAANTNTQASLWPNGISGDLPIVVVRIREQKDMGIVRKLLRCHEYLRLKGLAYDFIILNEKHTTYFQELQDELQQQIRSTGTLGWLNKPGGIFILRSDTMEEKEIAHIFAVARITLMADESLKDQVSRKGPGEIHAPPLALTYKNLTTPRPFVRPTESLQRPDLEYFNGFGGFKKDSREYVIALQPGKNTPAPWINVIGNRRDFGFQISESGAGFTWSINSQTNRLTPWSNDPIIDPPGEIIYLRDDDSGEIWTPTPLPIRGDSNYLIKHGQGYSTFEHNSHGLAHSLTVFVPKDDTIKVSLLKLKNLTQRRRRITLTSYTEWVLGTQREKTSSYLISDTDKSSGAIFSRNPYDNEYSQRVAFADISSKNRTFTCSRKEFLGRNGNYLRPAALLRSGLSQKQGTGQDPCAVLQTALLLDPGEQVEIAILLGQCDGADSARALTLRYRDLELVKSALLEVTQEWRRLIDVIQISTPDPAMNLLMNNWLLYQTISCRYWSRTAFYQSGGAYGFRDQLQDCMAFVYANPGMTREHILRAAAHQFTQGDVQHWWHPPTGKGVRTRMTDDLLWLPYVVSYYIKVTGDEKILSEVIPFLEAPLLKDEEDDSYSQPQVSMESASLFEHCLRAIDRALALGPHDLPLMGTGDWNDGMNRVGIHGQGESIWLGWFLYSVISDFLPYCQAHRERYQAYIQKLRLALDKNAWDGEWYKRAFFDDGTPLGSALNKECRIDSLAQSWAVLSNAGDPLRTQQAMAKVDELLIRKKSKLVLLFTPPFDKTPEDPGYIKGYVPGVRENGGQYTHAAIWVLMAYAKLGNGNKALEIFNMINPIHHSQDELQSKKYKIEPYVIAADVYSGDTNEGQGGWSWYTGSASWYYRAGLESILGFNLRGNRLRITPCIPTSWKSYSISYSYGRAKYEITLLNPEGRSTGNTVVEMDGVPLDGNEIPLLDEDKEHKVTVTMISLAPAKLQVEI